MAGAETCVSLGPPLTRTEECRTECSVGWSRDLCLTGSSTDTEGGVQDGVFRGWSRALCLTGSSTDSEGGVQDGVFSGWSRDLCLTGSSTDTEGGVQDEVFSGSQP